MLGLVALTAPPAQAEGIIVRIHQQAADARSGAEFGQYPIVEVVGDNSGSPVDGVDVTASTSGTGTSLLGTITVATNTNGRAHFTDLGINAPEGSRTLTFSVAWVGGTKRASQSVTVEPGPGVALAVSTAPAGAVSGVPLTTQPVIRIVDSGGNTASSNIAKTVTVTPSGGTVTGATKAAAAGIATFTSLAITATSGSTQTLTFEATGLASTSASITLGYLPAKVAVVTAPAGSISGATFATQPVVAIQEADGTQVPSSTAMVTASVSPGATLIGTTSVAATAGLATFTNLGISGTVGTPYTLTFSSAGIASAAVTVTPTFGTATALDLDRNAVGPASGAAFTTAPRIRIEDAYGNLVSSSTATVTATVSAGGTLVGTTSVAASGGLATFTDLGITGTAGTAYTITFSSSGLTSDTQTLTVTPGPPVSLALTTVPAGAVTGKAFTSQPVVRVLDSGGNTAGSGNAGTVTVSSSGGTLTGNAVSANAGIAAFSTLALTATGGTSYTLTFSYSVPGTSPTTASIAMPWSPAALSVVTPAAGAVSGTTFATQPAIAIVEVDGTRVITSTATVTASVSSGATLLGTTTATAVNGLATFANLGIKGTVGVPYLLTFSCGGLTVATASITPTFGTASKLGIGVNAAGAVSGSPFGTQPQVTILDAFGNVVTTGSTPVTAMVSAGSLTGTVTALSSGGVATFGDLGIRGSGGISTLTFTAPDLGAVSQSIAVSEPSPGSAPGAPAAPATAPTLASVAPSSGPVSGGEWVVITGTNLGSTSSVIFGASPGTELRVDSPNSLTVRTPPGTLGAVTVTVATAQGSASQTNAYTYLPAGQPVGTGVFVTTASQSGGARVDPVRALRSPANAEVITASLNVPTRVQVRSLPERSWFRANIRVGDQWHDLGAYRSTRSGRLTLRSLILTAPGTFDVRLDKGGRSFFVQIRGS